MITTLFIEFENSLLNVNYITSIKVLDDIIRISFATGQELDVFGSNGILKLKYNVIRHFLEVQEVYGIKKNIITFEEINRPDDIHTDGIWNNQTVKKYEWIDKTKLKVLMSDNIIRIVNLKLAPNFNEIKTSLDKIKIYNGSICFNIGKKDEELFEFIDNKFIISSPIDINSISIPQKEFKLYTELSADKIDLTELKVNKPKERKSKKNEEI